MASKASKGRRGALAPRKGDRRQLKVDPSQIVYIDERGIHIGIPERRAGKGRRGSASRRGRS